MIEFILKNPLPPRGGRARVGVETYYYVGLPLFYPHPNLPPARGEGLRRIYNTFKLKMESVKVRKLWFSSVFSVADCRF